MEDYKKYANDLIDKTKAFRNKYCLSDKQMLETHTEFNSIDELNQGLQSGCFRININDAKFECFFNGPRKYHSKKLYVFLWR